jgi:hypothetical protein
MQKRPTLSLRSKLLHSGNVKQGYPDKAPPEQAVRVPPSLSRLNEVLRRRALISH